VWRSATVGLLWQCAQAVDLATAKLVAYDDKSIGVDGEIEAAKAGRTSGCIKRALTQ
jgi:hypothetical protein